MLQDVRVSSVYSLESLILCEECNIHGEIIMMHHAKYDMRVNTWKNTHAACTPNQVDFVVNNLSFSLFFCLENLFPLKKLHFLKIILFHYLKKDKLSPLSIRRKAISIN